MNEPSPVAAAPLGLRERRRRETLREVSDAALQLFERNGFTETTVDDIADAAGISQRTFFRYYATKEQAVCVNDVGLGAVMDETVAVIRSGAPVVAALEDAWMRLFGEFDARPEEHRRTLRVRRLVQSEPALLARTLANEAERIDELTDAAVDAAGASADVLTARALVALVSTTTRLAFDEWARRAEMGADASVRDIYLELRRGLGTYARHLTGELL
ncbi:TetR family transcriptional regulator [Micrococcaceae bacterium Sec5.1]|uniref:TetR family transcriptional regulator n=1 Tax=Paenarthrobacter sp. RAF54_2 TaxID=3233061 RepID=UPI003365BEBD